MLGVEWVLRCSACVYAASLTWLVCRLVRVILLRLSLKLCRLLAIRSGSGVHAVARSFFVLPASLVSAARGRRLWFMFRLCVMTGIIRLARLKGVNRLLSLRMFLFVLSVLCSTMRLVLGMLMLRVSCFRSVCNDVIYRRMLLVLDSAFLRWMVLLMMKVVCILRPANACLSAWCVAKRLVTLCYLSAVRVVVRNVLGEAYSWMLLIETVIFWARLMRRVLRLSICAAEIVSAFLGTLVGAWQGL